LASEAAKIILARSTNSTNTDAKFRQALKAARPSLPAALAKIYIAKTPKLFVTSGGGFLRKRGI
jgi:hypothetical protein